MAASTRTIKETVITPRRISVVVGLALAVALVALVAIGALATSRPASTPLIAAPANPAVALSHGSSGDGIRADLPTSVVNAGSTGNARALLRAENPIVHTTVASTGIARALLRAEYPIVEVGAQAPVSPRRIPAR